MSRRTNPFVGAFFTTMFLMSAAKPAVAQPQFWFDPLPELPGGSCQVYYGPTFGAGHDMFSVGQSLDGDGISKAVVWTKTAGQPWEIEVLPNPFGNTESAAFALRGEDLDSAQNLTFSIGGYAKTPGGVCVGGSSSGNPCTKGAECPGGACLIAGKGSPQPVVWTGDGVGPWTVEVLPLPPDAVGGQVLAIFPGCYCPGCECADMQCFGDWSAGDGTTKAAHWTRDEATQIWTVELLPDYGPGFSSEATSGAIDPVDQANPNDDLLIAGGWVQTESNPQVPSVWEEQPGGGFNRIDLPMTPGAYLGSVNALSATDADTDQRLTFAVGYNATPGGIDFYRGVLYRRENDLWGAPLELPPLPGIRDSRATGVFFANASLDADIVFHEFAIGHSYMELSEGSERATLWEVAPDNTVTKYDMNILTVNLPLNVTLSTSALCDPTPAIHPWTIAGTFTDADTPSVPHGHILVLLSETDCNKNGMDDAIDLYIGTSPDANGNGVPDECEPRFSFCALPELLGGASEAISFNTECENEGECRSMVAGKALDGDGIWKAVVWGYRGYGCPVGGIDDFLWTLPNPFGNTESVCLTINRTNTQPTFEVIAGGGAQNLSGNFQPIVWTGDGAGTWIAEILPLPPGGEGGQVLASLDGKGADVFDWLCAVGTVQVVGTAKAVLWTRDQDSPIWTVELLPDDGPGFSSEATSGAIDPVDQANPNDDLLIIGGSVETETNPKVPCVWQELPGGAFERTDLPMTPGAYLGAVSEMNRDSVDIFVEFSAVGYNATIAGLADLYRGVLYRREAGVWGAPQELPPLPGLRDARPSGLATGTSHSADGFTVVGHSYSEVATGGERATLWEIAANQTVTAYDLNDLTVNLPPGVTLFFGTLPPDDDVSASPGDQESIGIAGTFTNDGGATAGPGSTPHAYVLSSFPAAPAADATGIDKTRFISFAPPGPSANSALRVTLASLHHVNPPYTGGPSVPFTSFEGHVRWVGPPAQYVESTATGTPLFASSLQCTPHYQDWSTIGLLHVTGSAIVPSSIYEVAGLPASCTGHEAMCAAVSAPLSINTTRWGDVEIPYNPPSATVQPDLGDVGALVNKFRSAPGAPIKARALLAGDDAFGNINTINLDLGFGHIAACVDAFRGKPYPHTIAVCP